jgi:hypothetical protein
MNYRATDTSIHGASPRVPGTPSGAGGLRSNLLRVQVLLLCTAFAGVASGSDLFTTNVTGTFHSVDQSTGLAAFIGDIGTGGPIGG